MFFKKNFSSMHNQGFTVLEMIVVLSIVGLISGVILFNYRLFTQRLALSAAAQEVSVAIRQAQAYGLSVKQTAQGSGEFDKAYGIAFDVSNGGNPKSYYLFVDKNSNGYYDGDDTCNPLSECVKKELILNAASISGFCGTDASNTPTPTCPFVSAKKMTVTFKRPNRDAFIYFFDSLNNRTGPYNMGQVKFVTPASGPESSVKVELSGQISTQ